MEPQPASLEVIQKKLAEVPVRLHGKSGTDAEWTHEIKRTLIVLGKELHWEVWTTFRGDPQPDDGEWLWDLCWGQSKKPGSFNVFMRLGLVVESEWILRPRDIIGDFQKLLCAKASAKLFIWQGNRALIKDMKDNISIWDDPPRTYLLADFDGKKQQFDFEIV